MMCLLPATSIANWPDLSIPAPRVGGGEEDAAIIIGIEDYDTLLDVPGARLNALQWRDYFHMTLGMPTESIFLVTDTAATKESMEDAIQDAVDQADNPESSLWFVFIGHGFPSKDGQDAWLIGSDARSSVRSLSRRSLSRNALLQIFKKGRAGQVRLILDACFSGRAHGGTPLLAGLQPIFIVDSSRPKGERFTILTAAASDQYAGPLPGSNRPSFSYLALGALRGWADQGPYGNSDDIIRAGEVYELTRVFLSTLRDRDQTPELEGDRDSVLAASPGEQAPDPGRYTGCGFESLSLRNAGDSPRVAYERMLDVFGLAGVTLDEMKECASKFAHRFGTDPAQNPLAVRLAPFLGKDVLPYSPEWVNLPAGDFRLGSEATEVGVSSGRHTRVNSFSLMKTEVTWRQYRACIRAQQCEPAHLSDGSCWVRRGNASTKGIVDREFRGDDQPVLCVDWNQANAYCEWGGGRLPTEREWEFAAKSAGQSASFPWGEDQFEMCERTVALLEDEDCLLASTRPVCSKPAGNTDQDLCDMSGNVWEWVYDAYDPYYGPEQTTEEGRNNDNPLSERVIRGGSWSDPAGEATTTSREASPPSILSVSIGFRCAREFVPVR